MCVGTHVYESQRRPSGVLFYYSIPYSFKAVSLTELGAKLAGNKHLSSDIPISGPYHTGATGAI